VSQTSAFVVRAEIELGPDVDSRAPGGAVTTALCGHWEHNGPCRWPHNNRIDTADTPAQLRIVVVTDEATRGDVARLIESALRDDPRWSVLGCDVDGIRPDEAALARSLAGSG
jgi:hypothetical protein